ncbi:LysR family transcriptional regulator [Acinetobacter puyangensis]|uniref:Transcriptional regulator, LysR family n=1 Tax=Acinetobacter puyangensis TaxID=1096779 RepID=A0A240E8D8_9GAMM|nr:LysR family transcriptional regulator [Acinetobacter puyangensis]SNX44781.1 transcriptional regulator, LysR family [Acinetobacter puyangensis]
MKQGLRHIKAFLMVAELKNFGRAASQLYISPSTLTLQIQQLEEELGLKLFDRTKRSVHITPEGQQMILPLKAVLTEYEYALEFSQNISEHVLGSINIAVLPTIASSLLPLWIKEFKKEYPRVKIIVQDLNANEIHHAVKSGTADLGIGTVELSDPHLTFNRLFEDELRVFFPPDHELAARKDIYLKDVIHFPQIVTMPGSSVYNTVKHAIENMGLTLENLDIACEVRYLSTAMGLIESNIGIAILPESTPINIKQMHILKKKIIDFPDTRTIHLMRLKSAHESLLLNSFIKVIYNNHKIF